MRSLFWLVVAFAVAVALVVLARVDSGYVLFFYPPYRVEMSMVFFTVAGLASFVFLYGLLRALGNAISLPATVRAWRARRRRERAHSALAAALQAYYEGRYARSEKEAGVDAPQQDQSNGRGEHRQQPEERPHPEERSRRDL